ncbi:alpha-L-fucosidase [Niabella sp. CC-SYL272]|uniref:alpha-L-fucosidase n=1 Tax=Niabella agricola TaxID=2891571 RepID=UPI001F459803|nr:alpha-L-fucosidase [Niabella agricola]MCF3111256.1 alpha-L-fucosidase [Niabella agricola]
MTVAIFSKNGLCAILLLVGLLLHSGVIGQAPAYDAEKQYQYPADPKVRERITKWQELKFGLFMHWGPYSQWDVVESWSICPEDWAWNQRTGPYAADYFRYKKAYEALPATFNPTRFEPRKWALAARSAGMRYMIFTTKHHDGFCMYDSKLTGYKVTDSSVPFSRTQHPDITRSLFDAFRDQQFMVGAYFSKPDWHSDDYWWSYFPPKDRSENYDRKKYADRWNRFIQYTNNQIQELMTGYGPISILWLDGNWANMDIGPAVTSARVHQPGLIVVDRHGLPKYVNYLTPEQKVPNHYIPVPWETCMTMGTSWSYKKQEQYKSARQLVQLLIDVVAKNGNLLLNIGPGPDGDWHSEAYDRLEKIGKWMQINGEAIYGTHPLAPYRKGKWAFTQKGADRFALYLPDSTENTLPAVIATDDWPVEKNALRHIRLLGYPHQLDIRNQSGKQVVQLSDAVRSSLANRPAWVFKIHLK